MKKLSVGYKSLGRVSSNPVLRWSFRLILLGILLGALSVAYLVFTFVNVWWNARSDSAGPSDAIVVMGAAQYDGTPSPVLRARLDHAVELYEAGFAPLVVVTGGKQVGDRYTQALAGYNYLRSQGIADENILLEVDGDSTYTELAATARILHGRGFERVLLVSDAYHSARLKAIASEVGLKASVSPTETSYGLSQLLRETAAVSAGRIIGFRRLDAFG